MEGGGIYLTKEDTSCIIKLPTQARVSGDEMFIIWKGFSNTMLMESLDVPVANLNLAPGVPDWRKRVVNALS